MRGIYRLKLALAVWTAAALGLGGAGCQQTYPFGQNGGQGPVGRAYPPRTGDGGPTQVVQAGYPPNYQPVNYRADGSDEYAPQPRTINGNGHPNGHPNGHGNGNGNGNMIVNGDGPPHGVDEGGAPPAPLPHEKQKTFHPAYIIEPPDSLVIDAIRLIPRPPYRIEPLDILLIQVAETLPNQPVVGAYPVSPEGTVNLGYSYGFVRVAGLTLEQAVVAVKNTLRARLNDPQVAMALASMRAIQMIRGEHLVGQDGTVTLGSYGCVNVTGLTLWQAKLVMERYLSRWFLNPEISISVNGYNSKVYYVIFDGGGYGQQIAPLPITGNETVLDAIAKVGGLPPVSSRRKIWVARPSPRCCYQLLAVDWEAITMGGDPATNWQLFPGDRVYVAADPLIQADNMLAKIIAPVERVLGITLLTTTTVQSFRSTGTGNGNGGVGIGGF